MKVDKSKWEVKKLGDVCSFRRGLTYPKDAEVNVVTNNIVLRSNNIDLESNKIVLSDLKYLNNDFPNNNAKRVEPNSILMCMSNGSANHIGKVALIKDNMNCYFGGFMGLFVPNNQIYSHFLYLIFLSPKFRRFISKTSNGINITNLKFQSLSDFLLYVPPLPEQQAIASELDAIQSLITKYKEQLNDYDNLAKSIFNEMFGDVVSNDKGWERGKIGDVCEFSQGVQVEVSNQSIVESSNKIRFLRLVDFTQANEQPRYIDIPNEKYIISKEDISMVRYGASVGYVCCGLSGAIANNLFKITPQKNILGNTFCTYFLKSDYFQGKICNNKKGCAMPAINFKTIKPIPIPLPPLPLQQTFAARITAIESQKDKLKQQITDLQTLFDSRMQYYFD